MEFDDEIGQPPTPILEIERPGSGRRQSIKGMSNLIHEEIKNEDRKSSIGSGPEDSLKRSFSNYSQDKRRKVLSLTIEIEEPPYEEAAHKLAADNDVEDVMFSPPD